MLLIYAVLLLAAADVRAGAIAAVLDSLTVHESRVVGYPGAEAAAGFIERALRRAGVQQVRREEFPVVVPMDEGGWLRVAASGEEFSLHGVWPNGVRTPTLLPLTAPLIYGGAGEYADFDGKALAGRVVLMEFASWHHWLRAAALGARAIVFIEPDEPSWRQANAKYADVPLDIPRFWVSRQAGAALRELAQAGEVEVELTGRMEWQARPAWNIWGVVPGTDPALRDETVAVEAYYDGISVVPALAPSAEAACSIIGLLALADYLAAHPPARTVILLATSAHFHNRQGIVDFLNRYARRHPHYASKMDRDLGIDLFISLDLASHSTQVGVWNNTDRQNLKRFFAPMGRAFMGYVDTAAAATMVNGITPVRGMDWSDYVPEGLMANSAIALDAGLISLALATVNAERFGVDLPLDRPEEVDLDRLSAQIELINGALGKAFADSALLATREEFAPVLKDRLRDLKVQVRALPRRSQVPDRPIAAAVIALESNMVVDKALKGVRSMQYHLSDRDGDADIKGLPTGAYAAVAHVLDSQTGAVSYAPDLNERAQKFYGSSFADGSLNVDVQFKTNEQTIVVFPCIAAPFYDLGDPRHLGTIGKTEILGQGDVPPRQYGFALGRHTASGAGVVFAAPGAEAENRVKVMIGRRLLLLNNRGTDYEGQGYLLVEDGLAPTLPRVIGDMWRLNEARLELMRSHAIENQYLSRVHRRAGRLLERAQTAADKGEWTRHIAALRAAFGLEVLVYPRLVAALNDVISGIVFFLALAVPAAFLGERLLFAAADIRRQLLGFGAALAIVWLAISQVHPAFAIAHPLVILLSFAIMAMAAFVLFLIAGRFNRHMRERGDAVHRADVGRIGATYAAFMLGISNMRRRRLRTTLTLTTLVLVTFSVLSFTSFSAQSRFLALPLAHEGRYEGLLIRDRGWFELDELMLEYAYSHFATEAAIAPRNWLVLEEREKAALEIGYGDQTVRAYAVLGVVPQETEITGLGQVLSAGRFFASEDEASCLVPTRMAAALGIEAEDIGRARIRILGKALTVRGIVDAEALYQLRDLDDGLLTPVDFELSQGEAISYGDFASLEGGMEEYRPYTHLAPDNVLIAPYEVVRELGGGLRSIAVGFADAAAVQPLFEDFVERVTVSLFAGLPDGEGIGVYACSSVGATAVEGLGVLVIPLGIAALIVLNTMMGAVYERLREIGTYSSVGLSPLHISLLFLAEACAYAILGITLGYLLGQGVGLFLSKTGQLAGLQLNYSSTAAVWSALLVMGLVLLSTLYPARVAARLAVPDVTRRWSPPAPVGNVWEFRFPFMVSAVDAAGVCHFLADYLSAYGEGVSGAFQAADTLAHSFEMERGTAWALESRIWLSPLELGVTQHLVLCVVPEEDGACGLVFHLSCLSGDNDSWRRTNKSFLQAMRKELLIWNALKDGEKAVFRERALSQ